MKGKVAIFGGTFDPIHCGHLEIVHNTARDFHFSHYYIIPQGIPPHKEQPIASGRDRLEMVKLAMRHDHRYIILEDEIQKQEISYAVDMIRTINAVHPRSDLYYIHGLDSAESIDKWKSPKTILKLTEQLIINRPGYSREKLDQLLIKPDYAPYLHKLHFYQMPEQEVSSTIIRALIKDGKSVTAYLTREVRDYIESKNLYK